MSTLSPQNVSSTSCQYANAVFAGGGVRGIAHVGALEIAEQCGYRWQRVAGTSAGAIVASLVAAGYSAQELHTILHEIDYSRFVASSANDPLHLAEIPNLLERGGLHDSSYIELFVQEKLLAKGVRTFGDLLLPEQKGQDASASERYLLTVIVSDITQGRIVRLPQDARLYGIDPDALDVARAVRMSASIPFFFIPLQLTDANGVRSCIVDGGLLSNYPLFLFEHMSATQQTSIPTIGFQLVDEPQARTFTDVPLSTEEKVPCGIDMLKDLVNTMLSAHDRFYMSDAALAHTIAIPAQGIASTQFDLSHAQAELLYEGGKAAATAFFNVPSKER